MIEFENKSYKSVAALCEVYGVSTRTFNRRRSNGMNLEQCLALDPTHSRHAVEFEGKTFSSMRELLRLHNVPGNTYWQRKQRGLTQRQALGLDPIKPRYAGWREMGLCDEDGVIVEKAKYFLYEIVNTVNGKVYIGITTDDLRKRWATHLADSVAKTAPLYHAMRKYGIESFEMRLIRCDAQSGAELMRQEVDEIKTRNTTDRFIGYNLASGGSKGNSKPFVLDGTLFPSLAEAAAHFSIPALTFAARVRKGATPEQAAGIEPMGNLRGHVLTIEGSDMNLMDAVNHFGKNYRAVNTRIRRGWTYRQALDLDSPPPRLGRNKRSRPTAEENIFNYAVMS